MKYFKLIIIVLGVFLLTGCASNHVKEINYSELKDMIKNKQSFIVVVTQTGCSHCIEYEPNYKSAMEENDIIGYNLNITKMSKNDYDKFRKEHDFSGTPTTLFFKKGKEVFSSRIVGSASVKEVNREIKRLGYVK